jgi:hypothetical protein
MAKGMTIMGALMLGAMGAAATPAAAPRAAGAASVAPMAAFVHEIGGRRVVGYYVTEAGACAVTMMLADPVGEDARPAGASRLRMTLEPAATATLDGVAGGRLRLTFQPGAAALGGGDRLALTCGGDGRALIVDDRPATGRLASR